MRDDRDGVEDETERENQWKTNGVGKRKIVEKERRKRERGEGGGVGESKRQRVRGECEEE